MRIHFTVNISFVPGFSLFSESGISTTQTAPAQSISLYIGFYKKLAVTFLFFVVLLFVSFWRECTLLLVVARQFLLWFP
jgi:hypothetical protein